MGITPGLFVRKNRFIVAMKRPREDDTEDTVTDDSEATLTDDSEATLTDNEEAEAAKEAEAAEESEESEAAKVAGAALDLKKTGITVVRIGSIAHREYIEFEEELKKAPEMKEEIGESRLAGN